MTRITTLTTIVFANTAYSEPCYTDVGCDMSEQVIMVTPKQTGAGFCVELLNEENKFGLHLLHQHPHYLLLVVSLKTIVAKVVEVVDGALLNDIKRMLSIQIANY